MKEDKLTQALLVVLIFAFTAFYIFGWYSHVKSMERSRRDFQRMFASSEREFAKASMRCNISMAEGALYPEGRKNYLDAAERDRKRIDQIERKWPELKEEKGNEPCRTGR